MASDVRFFVNHYITEGWSPIPIPKGEKGPRGDEWQHKVHDYAIRDFEEDSNIGVHLGVPIGAGPERLYDVDLDDKTAAIAADILLPNTDRISGRSGKPRSHRFYACEAGITHQAWLGLGGSSDTIVELRGTSKNGAPTQTVLPPSIHPSGETITWAHEGKPFVFDKAETFIAAVRNVAIATLLARHFPGPGHRHAPRMAMAGFLFRAGMEEREILAIGKATMKIIGGDQTDWSDTAKSTFAKIQNNEQASGGPKLAECLGDHGPGILKLLNKWLGRTEQAARDEALDYMNKKHFFTMLGAKAAVGCEEGDVPEFVRPEEISKLYKNKFVSLTTLKKLKDGKTREETRKETVFDFWMEHQHRREFRRVDFLPPPNVTPDSVYNLWRGFAVEPKPGQCQRWLEHVYEVMCSANDDYYSWVINYLAATVQEPGTLPQTAIVMKGEQGAGKGVIVRTIGELFGPHYLHLSRPEEFTGEKNGALSGKVVVFADEAVWAGDKREVGALKRLITEPTLLIRRLYFDGVMERNFVHLFIASNNSWVFPAGPRERRAFVVKMNDKWTQNAKYFDPIYEELDAGGRSALLAYLLEQPVDLAWVRKPPITEELRTQQDISISSSWSAELGWWRECCFEGTVCGKAWPKTASVKELFADYTRWTQVAGGKRPLDKFSFGKTMGLFFSAEDSFVKRAGTGRERTYKMRELKDARDFFDSRIGSKLEWPEE